VRNDCFIPVVIILAGLFNLAGCPSRTNCSEPQAAAACGLELTIASDQSVVRVYPGEMAKVNLTLKWANDDVVETVEIDAVDPIQGVEIGVDSVNVDEGEAVVSVSVDEDSAQGIVELKLVARTLQSQLSSNELTFELVVAGPPGSPDRSLDFDGQAAWSSPEPGFGIYGQALDQEGRLFFSGRFYESDRGFLVYMQPDGSFHTDFGKAAWDALDNQVSSFTQILALDDSRILIFAQLSEETFGRVIAFDQAGKKDESFGQDGNLTLSESASPGLKVWARSEDFVSWHGSSLQSYFLTGSANVDFGEDGVWNTGLLSVVPVFLSNTNILVLQYEGALPQARLISPEGISDVTGSYNEIFDSLEQLGEPVEAFFIDACRVDASAKAICVGQYRTDRDQNTEDETNGLIFRLDTTNLDIDDTFGDSGFILSKGNSNARMVTSGVFLLEDGKFLAGHVQYSVSNEEYQYFLSRYNPDGSLDAGFGNEGTVETAILSGSLYLQTKIFVDLKYGRAILCDKREGQVIVARYWL
jgi:hypothetical protein